MFQSIEQTTISEKKTSIDELMHRSLKFRESAAFFKFFDFIKKFDHYSYYNNMLVYLQNEAVTFFGGTSYWKKRWDRTVKQEARPYVILCPMGPTMLVYDIMETEGKLTPDEFLEKGLGRKPFEVEGELAWKIWNRAVKKTSEYNIFLISKPLSYFRAGYVTTIWKGDDVEICLREGVSISENFPVLIHELAHLLLGHTGHQELKHPNPKKSIKLPDRNLYITSRELEAETVSYLICSRLGIQTQAAQYIAGYLTGEDAIKNFSVDLVIKAADKIESCFVY